MRRHDRRVHGMVRSILRDESELEDAVQQAWLQVYLHLGELEEAGAFSTWLVRVAANEAIGCLRRRARLSVIRARLEEDTIGTRADDPEERAAASEAVRLLERAVHRLPSSYSTVFVLRAVEGLSSIEAAAALRVSEEAVRMRLYRARALLRDAVVAENSVNIPSESTIRKAT